MVACGCRHLPRAAWLRRLLAAGSAGLAVAQVEQLSHDFYIFKEAKSGSLQVIYKRHQGGYGLIAPQ